MWTEWLQGFFEINTELNVTLIATVFPKHLNFPTLFMDSLDNFILLLWF
jgi:hypothetical protein